MKLRLLGLPQRGSHVNWVIDEVLDKVGRE